MAALTYCVPCQRKGYRYPVIIDIGGQAIETGLVLRCPLGHKEPVRDPDDDDADYVTALAEEMIQAVYGRGAHYLVYDSRREHDDAKHGT